MLTVCKICQGLRYLHSKGLVHRDIRSNNIDIGQSGEIKICQYVSVLLA